MRILFLNHNVAWRGGFFRAFHWGRHLAQRGHAVTVLTISERCRFRFRSDVREGVRIVQTPDWCSGRLRSGWDPFDAIARIGYVLPQTFDIVHSVDSRPVCILPALIKRRFSAQKTRLVLDWGDWWGRGGTIVERSASVAERLFAPIETAFEERFRSTADASVVLTSALRRRAIRLGVSPSTITEIPHGADVDRLRPRDKHACRRNLGLPSSLKILGFVGTMFPSERQMLLEAFRLVEKQCPNVLLAVIGRSVVSESSVAGCGGKVLVTGPIPYETLQDYVGACDVMLLPLKDTVANRGRWPSKIGDYLAAGRPVVASAVGDLVGLFESREIGGLALGGTGEFAREVLQVLAAPNLDDLGRNARLVAEQELDWRILTDRLERVYNRVLQSD